MSDSNLPSRASLMGLSEGEYQNLKQLKQQIWIKLLDKGYCLYLQKLPPPPWFTTVAPRQQLVTTCASPGCPRSHHIIPPSSWRLSLEPSESRTGQLPLMAQVPRRYLSSNDYGKGLGSVEWFCLSCIETMFEIPWFETETISTESNTSQIPALYQWIGDQIFPEMREHEAKTGYYALSSAQKKALYKWQAIHRYAEAAQSNSSETLSKVNRDYVLRWDGFDEDKLRVAYVKSAHGKLQPIISVENRVTTRQVHIKGQDVIGKKLSQVLSLLDEETRQIMEQENWSDPGPKRVSLRNKRKKKARRQKKAAERHDNEQALLNKRKRDAEESDEDETTKAKKAAKKSEAGTDGNAYLAGKKASTAGLFNGTSLPYRPKQAPGDESASSVGGEDGMDWSDAEAGDSEGEELD